MTDLAAFAKLDKKAKTKILYNELFSVDYLNMDPDDNNKYDRYVIDASFTFLHWNLVE